MQNRAFLKVSPVENVSFFQKEMFEGSYLSSYFRETNFRNNLDSSRVTGRKPWVFMIDSDSAVDKKP
jgi:hypothetical protein